MSEHDDGRAERAVRDALRQHADEANFAPLSVPVARQPRRLPRWLPAVAALVLVAVAALQVMFGNLQFGGNSTSAVPADASRPQATAAGGTPEAAPTEGWRWESFRVLTYQVPTSWGYGDAPGPDWCGGDQTSRFGAFVDVGTHSEAMMGIACSRTIPVDRLAMFVTVHPAGADDLGWDVPSGWSRVKTEINGYVLEVVHPDKDERVAREIVGTARPLPAVDGNGCPATATALQQPIAEVAARVSLCQYNTRGDQQLLASKLLTGDDGRYVEEALGRAPQGSGPGRADCNSQGNDFVLVRLWGAQRADYLTVRYAGCSGNGIKGLGEERRLTQEACTAVLQAPLVFTTGYGQAASLCNAGPTPSAAPTPSGPEPSPSR